ncbi:phospholipase [Lentzea pudingi]|uniref:Phospholipase n=1 Tax=Lentzea pudingi TaxID=1789439 RepID=A0ABQ2HK71_9PSEU|nr:phospholipase [Lentzea pudingi]
MGARKLLLRLPAWFRFTVITLAVFVCGVIASRPATGDNAIPPSADVIAAANAVDAFVAPSATHDPYVNLPSDFAREMGRDPKTITAPDGTLRVVDAGGGCSGPAGDTEWDFSAACRAHDLGYDLLRYADHKGDPLGPQARKALDDRLTTDLHAQCRLNPRGAEQSCHAVAETYALGLKFNSWRQRWGAPGHEPVVAWAFGSAMVVFLLLARLHGRRREDPVANSLPLVLAHAEQDRYATFLRLFSLALLVLGETVAMLAHLRGFGTSWLWALQAVPLFFFAGGHANLRSWQAHQGGFGCWVSSRTSWLLRPVLAFVLLWVVLFAALNLMDVEVDAYSRLITHPLWFLGVYLLAVAATPAAAWLHEHFRRTTPFVLVLVTLGVEIARTSTDWKTGGYVNLIVGALLMQQIGFFYADGTLTSLSRKLLAALGAITLPALVFFSDYPRSMMVLGVAQVCLALLARGRVTAWLDGRIWHVVTFVRRSPMTVYLAYLAGVGALVGLLGLTQAPIWLVLGLVPLILVFHRFERRLIRSTKLAHESHRTRLATAMGVSFGTLGVLGFVVSGFLGDGVLVLLPVDPLQNLIHLLLGWYLIHTARNGSCDTRLPWLLTALACVPPMLALDPTPPVVVLHAAAIGLAVLGAIPRSRPRTPATTATAATPSPDDLVAAGAPATAPTR